jgi:hypothetical protein
MALEKVVAVIALGWLIGAVLVMGWSIRRGRVLAEALAQRHPEAYEALGRPRPGYFHSVRRSRFAQFVARREFENLGDPELSARFEHFRKSDTRLVLFILASMTVLALLALTVRYAAQ